MSIRDKLTALEGPTFDIFFSYVAGVGRRLVLGAIFYNLH